MARDIWLEEYIIKRRNGEKIYTRNWWPEKWKRKRGKFSSKFLLSLFLFLSHGCLWYVCLFLWCLSIALVKAEQVFIIELLFYHIVVSSSFVSVFFIVVSLIIFICKSFLEFGFSVENLFIAMRYKTNLLLLKKNTKSIPSKKKTSTFPSYSSSSLVVVLKANFAEEEKNHQKYTI